RRHTRFSRDWSSDVCSSDLGSGLFDFAAAGASNMPVALGTDVGGGTSFSMLQTMAAAHNVARMSGHHLSAHQLFYLATEGAAQEIGRASCRERVSIEVGAAR